MYRLLAHAEGSMGFCGLASFGIGVSAVYLPDEIDNFERVGFLQ